MTQQLLEREVELGTLRELIASAAGGAGAVALVEGPAGIGKSSLLREAFALAGQAGCETAAARGSKLEREFAFGLVRQLFEPLLSASAPKQRRRLLAGAAGLAGPLFEALDAELLSPRGEASQAALHGLYWLTVNLATDRPLVLVVDDAHWGDAPSLRFLAYLVNRLEDLPVLVVVGVRPLEAGAEVDLLDELAASPSARAIRPASLSVQGVERLVGAELAVAVDRSFADACYQATRGNPLLLRELLVTLRAERIEPVAAQAARVLEVAPRSVARSVARRLRGLGPDAGELARAFAVLGEGADLSVASRLAGVERGAAAVAVAALVRAEVLSPGGLDFVHPVVRAAIYSELSPPQRARWHRVAAGILAEAGADEDEIALHVLAGEPSGDRWVVDVLRRAARRAHSRGAPDVAATYLERAVSEPPPGGERVDVLLELGSAELAANRARGHARMREALKLAEDPRVRGRVALQLGRSLFAWADYTAAAKVFLQALTELPGDEQGLRKTLEAQLISVCLLEPSLQPRVIDRVLALIGDSTQVTDPVLLATLSITAVAVIEPADRGAALAERALADGRLSIEENPTVVAMAAVAMMAGDRLAEAKSVWDRAITDARRRGSHYATGFAWTMRAFVLVRMGLIAAAEADARGALEHITGESPVPVCWILPSLIEVLLERGELGEASRLLEQYAPGGELPQVPEMYFLLESMGRLRLAQNRSQEGIEHLRECGRRLERVLVRNPGLIPWRAALAPALAAAGEREEARALAHQEIGLARAFDVPRELGIALRAAGLVEHDAEGIELLREAVNVLEAGPAELERARALTDLGAALRREGHRSEAREPLRAGLGLAQQCGATALAERAHGELLATGARPRRFVRSGVDALTVSERRVAEMASERLTNRDIAQALFVTEKTVEAHLHNTYQKLDINSRSELSKALSRPQDLTSY